MRRRSRWFNLKILIMILARHDYSNVLFQLGNSWVHEERGQTDRRVGWEPFLNFLDVPEMTCKAKTQELRDDFESVQPLTSKN